MTGSNDADQRIRTDAQAAFRKWFDDRGGSAIASKDLTELAWHAFRDGWYAAQPETPRGDTAKDIDYKILWERDSAGLGKCLQETHNLRAVKEDQRARIAVLEGELAALRSNGGCAESEEKPMTNLGKLLHEAIDRGYGSKEKEQPTPRTDAAEFDLNGRNVVWSDFARQLERELAEAEERVEHMNGQHHDLCQQLAELEAARSAMAPLNAGDRLYYRNALDRAAYALFQIKRMVDVPRHVIDFAVEAHSEACKALDDDGAIDGRNK